jgi:uncharacterized protein YndB with AHSA1/START domain
MPDILQDFPIKAEPARVFAAVSTPEGLDRWWTETCSGQPGLGARYDLGFGPSYHWVATVSQCEPGSLFELTFTQADDDWRGTRVGFQLAPTSSGTQVRFYHLGWPEANEHYRISCHCWALYLRLLRRWLEFGETVPYADRLDV